MVKSKVSVVRCENYNQDELRKALKESFNMAGGIEKFAGPGRKVALKPNLVLAKSPETAATTHPELISVLSSMLIETGASVKIVESPGGPYTVNLLKSIYKTCGVQACEKSGAQLNFDVSETQINNPEAIYLKKLTVITPLLEADIIINLPKLKTHGQMVYTGAVKNMFGAIAGEQKAKYHLHMCEYERFADALIDIFLSVKPHFNIMDAVTGMEGHGPTAGTPRHMGLLMASEDAFALDFTALKIIGVTPSDVPVIKQGIQRDLCPPDMSLIDLRGVSIEDAMIKDFKVPQLSGLRNIQFTENKFLRKIMDSLKPRPVFLHKLCTGCSACVKSCPAGIIKMNNRRPYADLSKCIRCFCCQELCPQKAITIKTPLLNKIIFSTGVFIINKIKSNKNQ
jgi:uncharacterized protein (DUF362 family)/NAD-dependent dihydropyrimidine dehydrogenase PreA subunit